MITLKIDNSLSQIIGLSREQHSKLRRVLSYRVQGAYFSGDPNGGVRFLITNRGVFASGLIKRVLCWSKLNKLPMRIEDNRKRPLRRPGLFKMVLK